jgi:hypothetical protein
LRPDISRANGDGHRSYPGTVRELAAVVTGHPEYYLGGQPYAIRRTGGVISDYPGLGVGCLRPNKLRREFRDFHPRRQDGQSAVRFLARLAGAPAATSVLPSGSPGSFPFACCASFSRTSIDPDISRPNCDGRGLFPEMETELARIFPGPTVTVMDYFRRWGRSSLPS